MQTDQIETTGWTAYADPMEVMPNSDLRPHEPGAGCWCRPFMNDGVIVHNSMDRREEFERGERKAS